MIDSKKGGALSKRVKLSDDVATLFHLDQSKKVHTASADHRGGATSLKHDSLSVACY